MNAVTALTRYATTVGSLAIAVSNATVPEAAGDIARRHGIILFFRCLQYDWSRTPGFGLRPQDRRHGAMSVSPNDTPSSRIQHFKGVPKIPRWR